MSTWHFNMDHFKNGLKLWSWNFEQLTPSKLSSSGGWIIKLTFPASLPSLSSPPSCFSCSTAILFSVKNELSICCHFIFKTKTKEQSHQKKRESIGKATYVERRNVCFSLSELHGMLHTKTIRKHIAWNDSYFACSFQASKHTYFFEKYTFIVACCFGSTNIWGKFFSCQYDSPIISFCVKIEHSALMMQKCSLDWTLTDCSHIQVWINYP